MRWPWCLIGLFLAGVCPAGGETVAIRSRDLSARAPQVVPEFPQFDNLTVTYGTGGFMEWTARVRGGRYWIHFFYCSGQRRPCRLSINGRQQPGEVLGKPTGGFMAAHLRWQTYGPFDLKPGASTIRLAAPGNAPHLKGLVVSTGKAPPPSDPFGDPRAEAKALAAKLDVGGLRAAITDAHAAGRANTARGRQYLARLGRIEKAIAEKVKPADERQAAERLARLAREVQRLRHDALVADNPVLDFDKMLFVKRFKYNSNHYYTDYINSRFMPGGNLCILDLKSGAVTEIVRGLAGGVFGRYDLSFDAGRIVFAWKKGPDDGYRIYEVGLDGRGLRQLTFPPANEAELIAKYRRGYHHGTDDMNPCYLPDGGIVFISTRCRYGILCDGPDIFTTSVLYRMDGDGKNVQKLTNSAVSEAAPCVMPDGRILYTRWEYLDKGTVSVKCLWAMQPDGCGSAEIYGNDIALPPTFIYGRPIPGHPDKFVMLGTPHCPQNAVGTVIRLDMTRNVRTREPMTYMTPLIDIRAEGGFHYRDAVNASRWTRRNGPLFKDPYPLSDKFFLVTLNEDKGYSHATAWGLYLLHETGTVARIHDDPQMGCFLPMPLRPRTRPPVRPTVKDPELAEQNLAKCIVTDVYHGLENTQRGTIKYLRVIEQVPRPWAARRLWDGDVYDQQHAGVTKATHLGLKVLHGVVPVEEDGSACFLVPADKNLSLQALDGNYMAVQTERTYVNYRPGEVRACVGCHEMPNRLPATGSRVAMALRREPSIPGPQPGDPAARRPLHYPTDVQPVLDEHCVRCHGGEKTEGRLDLTGTLTGVFNRSYENLLARRDLLKTIGENHPKTGNVHYLPARSLGSHASKLIDILRKGHEKVTLSQADMVRLVTWVDTNCQYYGSYYGRRNLRYQAHPNFRPTPTFATATSLAPPLPDDQR